MFFRHIASNEKKNYFCYFTTIMTFEDIIGYESVKKHLKNSIQANRIAHAQLFVGPEGCGTLPMAIAYASYILCQENETCLAKCRHFSHPDLHYIFPTATTNKVKKDPVSSLFTDEWKAFIEQQPYGSLFDWYIHLGIENKQGNISVNEAKEISAKLSLKAFEGGYKVMIIWMAEKMNTEAANKLLKLLEEPPTQTIFLLVTEDENAILETIKSRCQILRFPPLGENTIKEALQKKGVIPTEATKIALRAQGNYNKALSFLNNSGEDDIFEKWFILWVRTAFRAKGNKTAIHGLLQWSEEVAATGREMQKQFLMYCCEVFRQALLLNYQSGSLVYTQFKDPSFQLQKFAPFIHGKNIEPIHNQIEEAFLNIERNGNAKMIFTDLSIKLTRLLHTPK
ncbi:DNA polymerase III subunit delta [Capnocytophaga canimorsus]|uniref:DNA polymerase III subunit delta n=2 Tax=Capnocytophaga canimorsus TaxID=28188 RepID=A0A0B7HDQ0_9FLAO|nr:DNA polymerase-3 subunit delta' [Capnocytophaga canimorsus]CEN37826.1 DNA polymerase III subunit delta [Capnocytophaga canimorsus]STA72871.1 DNA polymerase III subunit delta' [Capnocytophaga canimorsus]